MFLLLSSRSPLLLCLLNLLVLTTAHPKPDKSLLVQTSLFQVQGYIDSALPNVRKFLGIPYAEPPLGSLRFRPPVTKKPSLSTINATAYGNCCIQQTGGRSVYSEYLLNDAMPVGFPTSEDCLSLNVYAPTKKNRELLPVMIWIHGGGLTTGCSNEVFNDGAYVVKNHQDVIVVTVKCVLPFSTTLFKPSPAAEVLA